MAEFSTIPAFGQVVTIAWSGVMTPPSAELSGTVPVHLPLVGVTLLVVSAFAETFDNGTIIRVWQTPSKNDKYHTFGSTIYCTVNIFSR